MYFNSVLFLLLFFPCFFLLYLLVAAKLKNYVMLIGSLLFLAFNQFLSLLLIIVLVCVNFFIGKRIEDLRHREKKCRRLLFAGCSFNLAVLVLFKLLVSAHSGWSAAGTTAGTGGFIFPIGLSYVSFQMISYLIDVRNDACSSEKSFLSFSLYALLFPKILVGPVARYRDLSAQLVTRTATSQDVAAGLRRFVVGLMKKVLIADTLSNTINPAFALSAPSFSTGTAWFVLIGFAIQLYFDFSGFTDMAIGLARMAGFRFVENFDFPYISRSIGEFWRRWHISLSSWFRDYVFLPLEVARRQSRFLRQQTNILLVFLLTGLWHGFTISFLAWGAFLGLALALEMSGLSRLLKKAWVPLQHVYALSIILAGWVFFRSTSLGYAVQFFARLAGAGRPVTPLPFALTRPLPFIDPSVWLALALGVILSVPVVPAVREAWRRFSQSRGLLHALCRTGADGALLCGLLVTLGAMTDRGQIVTNIYARF